MNTFLLLWNPKHWKWETLEQDINEVALTGKCSQRWSCGNTKGIQIGDRTFLLKLGTQPKGVIASGYATSTPFFEKHWNEDNKDALYINVDFEVLLAPDVESILEIDIIKTGNLVKQNWLPRSSGISIKSEIVDELEALWLDFLTPHNLFKIYTEGTPNSISIIRYERNPSARKKCIDHYGYSCTICNFNFEKTYGEVGKEFIHVHHLTQIATVGKEYKIDPINDLRPVCPNCHSIIHKKKTAFSIDEMKQFINVQ